MTKKKKKVYDVDTCLTQVSPFLSLLKPMFKTFYSLSLMLWKNRQVLFLGRLFHPEASFIKIRHVQSFANDDRK